MHGLNPLPIDRQGFISQRGLIALAQAAGQFGLSGGVNDTVGSQGITPLPQLPDACFAIIDDYDGNRHAWTEVSLADPENIQRMVGGRRGTIDVDSSSEGSSSSDADGIDDQTAWGLNGESYPQGTIVYVIRINYNAWGIVGGCCDGSSSSDDGSYCFEVDCDAGTINVIDCDDAGGGGSSNPPTSSDRDPPTSSENPDEPPPPLAGRDRGVGGTGLDGGGIV